MSTKILEKKVNTLSRQMANLHSLVISVIAERDPEGEYRPQFVKRILLLNQKKQRGIKFTTSEEILNQIS